MAQDTTTGGSFDWKKLTKNKPLMYGLGAAALAGVYVLYKRKQTTGSTTSGTTQTAATAGAGGYTPAQFDSTGTDVASWLGNYSGNLQNQLDAYQQQLTTALQGLQGVTGNSGPPGVVTGLAQDPNSTRGALSFHWAPVAGATQYEVYEQSDLGGSAPMYVNSPNVTWTGLTPGVKHEFFVRAVGPGGTQSTPATIFAWPDPSLK